jgi:UDP-N-acetylmuramyl pentapeptide synthase
MRAALAHLDATAGERRRVAILGDMAELGPAAPAITRRSAASWRGTVSTSCLRSASLRARTSTARATVSR